MKTYYPSQFEMDRRIKELEHAITANDEHLQKVEAQKARLLTALKIMLGVAGVHQIDLSNKLNLAAIEKAIAVVAEAEGQQ